MTTILAFALKRSVNARLQLINSGAIPTPVGCDALVGDGVHVSPILPADPDRICVYGTPVRSTRTDSTAERVTATEVVTVEIRIRIYQPGNNDEDASAVDLMISQVANAVAVAVLDGDPIVNKAFGTIMLSDVLQWPTALTAQPEPSVMGLASVIFTAELVTN